MNALSRIACCGVLLCACAAWAQDDHPVGMSINGATTAASTSDAAASSSTEAEVIKVDPKNNKVTLKHGEIKSLNMPPMTMDFHVEDEALFAQLHPGGKIRFTVRRINGIFTILTVEEVH